MFKFFNRIKTVVGSEWNAMLDKAEDPVKMLDQFMREMEEDIKKAEGAVARQIANERILKHKANDAEAMVIRKQQQAEKAVEAGNDDLARRALEEKRESKIQVDLLDESWTRADQDANEVKVKLDQMKKEYSQMRLKKDALKARAETAKAKTKINRTMSNIGGDNSGEGFERMQEKVLQYEAEAETTEVRSTRKLDEEFKSLEGSNANKELAALKAKMKKK